MSGKTAKDTRVCLVVMTMNNEALEKIAQIVDEARADDDKRRAVRQLFGRDAETGEAVDESNLLQGIFDKMDERNRGAVND